MVPFHVACEQDDQSQVINFGSRFYCSGRGWLTDGQALLALARSRQDRINLVFISRFSSSPSCQHTRSLLSASASPVLVARPFRASNCKSVANSSSHFLSPLPPSIILKLFNLSRHFLIRPESAYGLISSTSLASKLLATRKCLCFALSHQNKYFPSYKRSLLRRTAPSRAATETKKNYDEGRTAG